MIDETLLQKLYQSSTKQVQQSNILNATIRPIRPIVTQQDADSGFLMRYFARPVADINQVVEIDQDQYQNLQDNPRFLVVELRWKIVGKPSTTRRNNIVDLGVGDINQLTVSKADLTFGGLRRYIRNYLEFWLYDENGERILPSPTPTPSVSNNPRVRRVGPMVGETVIAPPVPTQSSTDVPTSTPTPSVTPTASPSTTPTPTVTPTPDV